ncbi:MAG: hypothetical protein ACRETX_02835 [Steroidobacteraceae bacterium]
MVIEIGRASMPPSVATWPLRVYADFQAAAYLPRLLHPGQHGVADSLDAHGRTCPRGGSCARIESTAAARLRQRD